MCIINIGISRHLLCPAFARYTVDDVDDNKMIKIKQPYPLFRPASGSNISCY